jgi:rRNA processing protein Krr1/Pno1
MTQEIYLEDIANILKSKPRLERELKVKITNKGKDFSIEGTAENEYLALKVFEAMSLGFSVEKALLLKNENNILHKIEIKKVTKRHDLERIRARIIGTHGKTIGNLSKLSECHLALNGNQIGIIGDTELIDEAILAVKSMIHGSKQGNVYTRLEKETKKRREDPEYHQNIKNELKKNRPLNN